MSLIPYQMSDMLPKVSANRSPSSQNYGFSSSHVWMWKLDYKKCWVLKNWCFWTVFWRRLLRVPWSARRYNQSILKENSPEYSLEGLMLKLKLQSIVWPHDMKNWLTRKDPDTGREWRREKGMTEDEMVGWHHWLKGHEFDWASSRSWWWTGRPGVLQSMGSQGIQHEQLNWTEKN